MPMESRQPLTTSLQNVRLVPAKPKVKSSKTRKLFNAGALGNLETVKSVDPSCYHYHVGSNFDRDGLFEIVEMNMKDDFEWSRPGMVIRSGTELQAARRAAAERFTAIAMQYVPEGYTVEYRKSLSGRHYGKRKLIKAPRPVTRRSLYIFLHECAHAQLGHSHNGRTPRHVEEMQAEQWAHAKMRENGVSVPRSMTQRAKAYVAHKITQARRRGAKNIDSAAARYAAS